MEWHPNHCCSYHFFKRVIIQENEGARNGSSQPGSMTRPIGPGNQPVNRIVGTRTVEDILAQGKHYHRFARHEHP